MGFQKIENKKVKAIEKEIFKKIESFFAPEFINRLTKIVYFKPLSEKAVLKIIDKELSLLQERKGIKEKKINFLISSHYSKHTNFS